MKGLSVIIAVLLIVAFVAGCGVSKNKYDTVVKDAASFQVKAKDLTQQITTLKTDYEKQVKSLNDLKTENAKLLRENKELKAEVEKLQKATSIQK